MPLLEPAHVEFMRGPVAITASSRTAANEPVLTRINGARVSADRSRVTLLVCKARGAAFLEAVLATRVVATVFSRPKTHRTIQLKGTEARAALLEAGDEALALAYTEAFVAELVSLGYRDAMVRNMLWMPPQDLAAIEFAPCLAYDQTPGPRAGVPLSEAA